jgi:hypothetical protein
MTKSKAADYAKAQAYYEMQETEKRAMGIKTVHRAVVNWIEGDLVSAEDYSECDHSAKGKRNILFHLEKAPVTWGTPLDCQYDAKRKYRDVPPKLKKGYAISVEYAGDDEGYLTGVRSVVIITMHPDADLLFDL